jgi:16S rRNA (guanine527-N7)-methyltransferase
VFDRVDERLAALADRHGLAAGAAPRLRLLLDLVADAPISVSAVRDLPTAVDVHAADSLSALALPELRVARTLADLGSGGGFPGLPLALALPGATVTLIESSSKKCVLLREAIACMGLDNVRVIDGRVEQWAQGRRTQDVVCARAVAPLGTLVEYAAPLLLPGGHLVAWKANPGAEELSRAVVAAQTVGMAPTRVVAVEPFDGVRRSLHIYQRVSSVPKQFPRRPGMARKRPL